MDRPQIRRTIRTERRRRGLFGWFFLLIFIGFNLLMLAWLISYWGTLGQMAAANQTEAGQAGMAIGGTIASSMIFFLWACGAVILGLFTFLSRGKKIIVEEEEF